MLSGLGSTVGRRGWMMRFRMAYSDAVVTAVVITNILVSEDGRTACAALSMKSISGAWVWWCVSWDVFSSPCRAITRSAGSKADRPVVRPCLRSELAYLFTLFRTKKTPSRERIGFCTKIQNLIELIPCEHHDRSDSKST